ncbi:MAG: helix-turn-helix domain-containing protein, partial [Eubacterium sp.]|nr:helix-turn-helix domain-containing protein [Eubacterium sp.]
MSKTHIAVKYRIYPNTEQIAFFQKTFGCCRFVYNMMLTIQK